jgi:hypothetical protein
MGRPTERRRRAWRIATLLVLLAAPASTVRAQTADGFFIAAEAGIGLQTDDLLTESAIGGALGYRFDGGLLLLGEYLYAGTDFYHYVSGDGWQQAESWSDVPSGSSGRSDWIFYRRRHVIGFSAGLSGRVARLGLFATGGILLNAITLSDAAKFYPEFAAEAERSSIGSGRVLTTTALRGGLTYPADGAVAATGSWLVSFERPDGDNPVVYVRRSSVILLGVVFQAGGLGW